MTLGWVKEVWLMKGAKSKGVSLREGNVGLYKAINSQRELKNGLWNELWAYFQAALNNRRIDLKINED